MKRSILLFTALFAVVLFASTAFAASITASKHNLSATGSGAKGGYNEVCVYCHTPHNGGATVPLWNRATPAGPYTMYTSGTLNGVPAANATSLACLSCHDGVSTLSTVTNGSANTQAPVNGGGVLLDKIASGNALVGTNLSNDHPIGVILASSGAGLVAPPATVPLFGGAVECASCHNVHDNAQAPFLRISNVGSALCLSCHTK